MHRLLRVLVLAICAAVPAAAHADSTTVLAEYNGTGSYSDPGPYQPSTVIGTFTIDSDTTALTISGTFGNSLSPNTSAVDLYLGSILVASCEQFASCYYSLTPTAWTATLTAEQLALLGTGVVDFTVVQTSEYWIRLGETTLTQVTGPSPVPEPASIVLLATGALATAGAARRRLFA